MSDEKKIGSGVARSAAGWLGIAGLVLACGGDAKDEGRVPSMLGRAPSEAQSGTVGALEILSVTLQPARPAPGREVRADVALDHDGGAMPDLVYEWRAANGRVLGDDRSLDTDGLEEGASLELTVTAVAGDRQSEPFTVDFSLATSSIEIALVAIDDSEGNKPGAVLEAVVESTDESAGGYDVLHEWLVDGQVVGRDDELDTSALSPGDRVVLAARLEFDDRTTRPVRSQPVVMARGDAPRILTQPEGAIEAGRFRYRIRATSPEPGAEIQYELLAGPDGMTVDADSGLVEWRPGESQRGRFQIEVVARDQWGTGTAQAFEIRVEPPGVPPASMR